MIIISCFAALDDSHVKTKRDLRLGKWAAVDGFPADFESWSGERRGFSITLADDMKHIH